eukprot:9819665-Alexandrium_andersonii.AAC.1
MPWAMPVVHHHRLDQDARPQPCAPRCPLDRVPSVVVDVWDQDDVQSHGRVVEQVVDCAPAIAAAVCHQGQARPVLGVHVIGLVAVRRDGPEIPKAMPGGGIEQ